MKSPLNVGFSASITACIILGLTSFLLSSPTAASAPVPLDREDPHQIIERGQNYSVYEKVGSPSTQFTLLENNLHYFEDGLWKESEDLIESFPDGAIARRGPDKAIFSNELNSEAVFDIQSSDGSRIQGGVRAIQLTEIASGKSIAIGAVKDSVKAQLLPPNRILYEDAFEGIRADVLLVWKHNVFSQDVILRERPVLPEGWAVKSTRLEVLTEFIVEKEPELRSQVSKAEDQPELEDHAVIHFGPLAMIMGQAFLSEEEDALALGSLSTKDSSTPVLKQWHVTEDGRHFLVESANWASVSPMIESLPAAPQAAINHFPADTSGLARAWPKRVPNITQRKPIEMAAAAYQPKGYVVDFIIIPDSGTPTTFLGNQTYYIKTSYSSGSSVTFQPGTVIKYKNNAYLLLYGAVSFPSSGQMPIFTSRNDNGFGEVIKTVAGETDSDGNPALHRAAQAIWIYYVNFSTTLRNSRVRWAQVGVRYDANTGVTANHFLTDMLFENCATGIHRNVASGTLYLTNVKKCNVTTEVVAQSGSQSGTMALDCGVVSTAWINNPSQDVLPGDPNKNSQTECSFVVVNANTIVASFFDTHLSEYELGARALFTGNPPPRSIGWAMSANGGVSFTDNNALPPTTPANALQGDAGDPVMARDSGNGAIYLLGNPSRESATLLGFRLWKSIDNGQSFSLLHTNVPSGIIFGDKPMIAVNDFSGTVNYHYLYVVGTANVASPRGTFVTHSINGGVDWASPQLLKANGNGADVAVGPNGTVYVFYLVNNQTTPAQISLEYSWRLPLDTNWRTPVTVAAHPDSQNYYSRNGNASGQLKRSNDASTNDFFVNNGFPRIAVNRITGRVYVVYADLPFAGSSTDRGDIFINEGTPAADGSLTFTGVRRVNNDGTATDQWNPSIAINPAGTQLFIGYYSRQTDPSNNALIRPYGARANIANGLATATIENFAITSVSFTNLFAGTTNSSPSTSPWLFDHVWIQGGVSLDNKARRVEDASPNGVHTTEFVYQNFCADDYTWASADSTHFYFAWCDRSLQSTHNFGGINYLRADPNVRFARIKQ